MNNIKLISKLVTVITFLLSSFMLFAQKNNPYNQKGADIIASVKIIEEDYKKGKFSGVTDEAINYYINTLPVKVGKVEPALVNNVVNTVKTRNADAESFINNSSLPAFSKQVLNDLLTISKAPNALANLSNKVAEINASGASSAEKEFTLTLTAVLHNQIADYLMSKPAGTNSTSAAALECYVDGKLVPCSVFGGMVGGLIGGTAGYICCGPGGAVVGAIIGAFVGSAIGSLC